MRCHIYSPSFMSVFCGLCYKDQDSEFLFMSICWHFLDLRSSAEEKLPILLFLSTRTSLRSPVAVDSRKKNACGYGTLGLPYFGSFSKCDGRKFSL